MKPTARSVDGGGVDRGAFDWQRDVSLRETQSGR